VADTITSLLGDTLAPAPIADEARARLEAALREAEEQARQRPDDPDALIWVGRRTAYLGNHQQAIDLFTSAIARWPDDARMYRHRGHRYISVRRFADAEQDFTRASVLIAGTPDEVEPDGQPNKRGIPTSTLHTNVWYHLALSRYLQGNLPGALNAQFACLGASHNVDMLVATTHWLYMTLRRLGRDAEAAQVLAPVTADLDVMENTPYHRCCLLYKGELTPEDLAGAGADASATPQDAASAYGLANWHLYNGREQQAIDLFRRIYAGSQWAAFGYIAAEAELARLGVGAR
jgi:tetratricopeptide (TPR) repeat protein